MRSIYAEAKHPAIDVWLRLDESDPDELAEAEANTYILEDGTFRVEWYLNAVGLVTPVHFDTYEEACIWYEENGYTNFTS
jgi:hypothetical protein